LRDREPRLAGLQLDVFPFADGEFAGVLEAHGRDLEGHLRRSLHGRLEARVHVSVRGAARIDQHFVDENLDWTFFFRGKSNHPEVKSAVAAHGGRVIGRFDVDIVAGLQHFRHALLFEAVHFSVVSYSCHPDENNPFSLGDVFWHPVFPTGERLVCGVEPNC